MSSEKLHSSESQESLNPKETKEHLEKIDSSLEKNAEQAKNSSEKEITEASRAAKSEAISDKEVAPRGNEKKPGESITKAEKTRTYGMTMKRARSQMSAPSKAFSKFIHNPAVEKTSDVMGVTVARPSGILGAGILGFLGISLVLYFAHKNGFEVSNPYTLTVGLLVGGWLLGLFIEFVFRSFKRLRD